MPDLLVFDVSGGNDEGGGLVVGERRDGLGGAREGKTAENEGSAGCDESIAHGGEISLSREFRPLLRLMLPGGERPSYVRDLSKKRQTLTSKSFRIIAETAQARKDSGNAVRSAKDFSKARDAHEDLIAAPPAKLRHVAMAQAGAA